MSTLSKSEQLRKCENTSWNRAGAYIILKDGKFTGKIKVSYPKDGAGTLKVFLWDFENELQIGSASGYGYDKLSAALEGMKFKDIVLTDHPQNWTRQLESAGYEIIQAI